MPKAPTTSRKAVSASECIVKNYMLPQHDHDARGYYESRLYVSPTNTTGLAGSGTTTGATTAGAAGLTGAGAGAGAAAGTGTDEVNSPNISTSPAGSFLPRVIGYLTGVKG